jgi:hypothetical protein
LKRKSWGKYFDITETKHQDVGDNCVIRTLVIHNRHQALLLLS